MQEAYTATDNAPVGFEYYPEIVYQAEADRLADRLGGLPFLSHVRRGRRTKREMCCFGWNYDPQRKALIPAPDPIPEWLDFLRERCAGLAGCAAGDFRQAIVTQYGRKNAGTGPHIDALSFGPVVLGVSLLTAAEMKFERDGVRYVKTLEPRSLYALKGEARYLWKHAINRVPRPPRVSVVFRGVPSVSE